MTGPDAVLPPAFAGLWPKTCPQIWIRRHGDAVVAAGFCALWDAERDETLVVPAAGRGESPDAAVQALVAAALAAHPGGELLQAAPILLDETRPGDLRAQGPLLRQGDAVQILLPVHGGLGMRVMARRDGTGTAANLAGGERVGGRKAALRLVDEEAHPFLHGWDVAQDHTLDDAALAALYETRFWAEVNPEIEDPYVKTDPRASVQETWIRESEAEFRRLARLVGTLEPEEGQWPAYVAAESLGHKATVLRRGFDWALSEQGQALMEVVLRAHSFMGAERRYNDQAMNRESGYNPAPLLNAVSVERPSAHERIAAHQALRAWLLEQVGPEDAARLLP